MRCVETGTEQHKNKGSSLTVKAVERPAREIARTARSVFELDKREQAVDVVRRVVEDLAKDDAGARAAADKRSQPKKT